MMGKQNSQKALFSYCINLDRRVRAEHPLRRIQQAIDFQFVREAVADSYGYNGNVSVDPVVILKLMFLLFFENVSSERELMRMLPERLDYLWFLGYGLEDQIPDHSVLSKARRRWGREVFEKLFVGTVQQCVEAGLVDGTKIHVDASLIDANASKDSVIKASPELVAAIKKAYGQWEVKLEDRDFGDCSPAASLETVPSCATPVNQRVVSTTDPDAAVVRQGTQGPRARYKHHRVVDDAQGVITAVETTPGQVDEGQRLMALSEQHQAHTQQAVETVVADRKYGTVANYRDCQRRGIRTHMADLKQTQEGTGRREGIFAAEVFVYDGPRDRYCCPAGEGLHRHHFHQAKQIWQYRAKPGVCQRCALRTACTHDAVGRSLQRHVDQPLVDRARQQAGSTEARRDRRRRRHLMEGSFADAANNHGFKHARWRALWRVQIQNWLIAAIQNIRILLRGKNKPNPAAAAQPIAGLGPDFGLPFDFWAIQEGRLELPRRFRRPWGNFCSTGGSPCNATSIARN